MNSARQPTHRLAHLYLALDCQPIAMPTARPNRWSSESMPIRWAPDWQPSRNRQVPRREWHRIYWPASPAPTGARS